MKFTQPLSVMFVLALTAPIATLSAAQILPLAEYALGNELHTSPFSFSLDRTTTDFSSVATVHASGGSKPAADVQASMTGRDPNPIIVSTRVTFFLL